MGVEALSVGEVELVIRDVVTCPALREVEADAALEWVSLAEYGVVSLDVVPAVSPSPTVSLVGCSVQVGVLPGFVLVELSGVVVVDELDDLISSISTYLFQWAMRSCNERANFTHVY